MIDVRTPAWVEEDGGTTTVDIEHRRRDETTLVLDQQLGRGGGGGDGRGSSRDECQGREEDSHTLIPLLLLITAVVPRGCTDMNFIVCV